MACQKCVNFWTALAVIALIMIVVAGLKPGEAE